MQDYFAKCNPLDESRPIQNDMNLYCDMERTRNNSVEEDLKIIRSAGKNLLKSSTSGYLLLMAKRQQR